MGLHFVNVVPLPFALNPCSPFSHLPSLFCVHKLQESSQYQNISNHLTWLFPLPGPCSHSHFPLFALCSPSHIHLVRSSHLLLNLHIPPWSFMVPLQDNSQYQNLLDRINSLFHLLVLVPILTSSLPLAHNPCSPVSYLPSLFCVYELQERCSSQ